MLIVVVDLWGEYVNFSGGVRKRYVNYSGWFERSMLIVVVGVRM